MPIFQYQAIDLKGRQKTGTIDADTARDAREKLAAGRIGRPEDGSETLPELVPLRVAVVLAVARCGFLVRREVRRGLLVRDSELLA